MVLGDSTFTLAEIEEILVHEGLIKGSEEYHSARRKRFLPTDMTNESNEALFIEDYS